ncbi:MAG: motility protein A [Planctomycetota bacterium]
MDIATLIGTIGALALLCGAILMGHDGHAGDISAFIDPVGLGIVIGGSLLTLFASMPMSGVVQTGKAIMKTVLVGHHNHREMVRQIVELAVVARRDGILALESQLGTATDPFLARGIRMVVDGTDMDTVQRLMTIAIHATDERHKHAKLGLDAVGKYGPAYGMVGTLIGLVLMLGNLDDPDAIGPGMAVALLGTMYGCIVSSCIFLPLSDKLTLYSSQETHTQQMVLEGILSIAAGDNWRIVEQKPNFFTRLRNSTIPTPNPQKRNRRPSCRPVAVAAAPCGS